jgi:hypothetical protein
MEKIEFIQRAVAAQLATEYGADEAAQKQAMPVAARLFRTSATFEGVVVPFLVKRIAKEMGLTKPRKRRQHPAITTKAPDLLARI